MIVSVGPNSTTEGVPKALARRATPVSGDHGGGLGHYPSQLRHGGPSRKVRHLAARRDASPAADGPAAGVWPAHPNHTAPTGHGPASRQQDSDPLPHHEHWADYQPWFDNAASSVNSSPTSKPPASRPSKPIRARPNGLVAPPPARSTRRVTASFTRVNHLQPSTTRWSHPYVNTFRADGVPPPWHS